MQKRPFTIGLVAGEPSGDILGAGLIHALKQKVPNACFFGIAGPLMKAEGCEAWYEIEELAFMGITEVFRRLPRLLKIRIDITHRFSKLRPDVFVGIDAPSFNIPIEKKLKLIGIKTIHYVSPSVWAWKKNRVFQIRKATDLVLALLPFEKQFYDCYHIPCRFIGHTIADIMPLQPNKQSAREKLNITHDIKCLAVLPGSRQSEIEMLSEDFLHAAFILKKDFPTLEILVPLVNQERKQQFEAIYKKILPNLSLKILNGQARLAMIAADVTLLASGTASLECMFAKCPMVVGYRMRLLTYLIAKRLVKIPFISLPNLLAGKALVKEFIQQDCQPELLAASLNFLLNNTKKVEQLKKTFLQLHQRLSCHSDQQAAEAVLEISKNK
ncbi:MAG: lipid-A-disaccharide synthase [Candidatus Arsenophonus melophagi]|nr:lipid-A-disaccharide synthase [Candidatus Arsenophonus melophagi]